MPTLDDQTLTPANDLLSPAHDRGEVVDMIGDDLDVDFLRLVRGKPGVKAGC